MDVTLTSINFSTARRLSGRTDPAPRNPPLRAADEHWRPLLLTECQPPRSAIERSQDGIRRTDKASFGPSPAAARLRASNPLSPRCHAAILPPAPHRSPSIAAPSHQLTPVLRIPANATLSQRPSSPPASHAGGNGRPLLAQLVYAGGGGGKPSHADDTDDSDLESVSSPLP